MNIPLPKMGLVIRRVRKQKGLKIKDLVDSVLSKSAINRIEHGNPVKGKALDIILDKLGIKKEDITKLIEAEDKEDTRIKLTLKIAENKMELGCSLGNTLRKIQKIDSLHPYAQVTAYILGRTYLKKRKWKKAKEHFLKAIKLSGKHEDHLYMNIKSASYIGLSFIAYRTNELKEAINITDKGIECFIPTGERRYCYCTLHSNKATYLEKLGRFDEVYSVVKQILPCINELDCKPPARAQFYQLEGSMLINTNQPFKAIETLYEGIEFAKNHKLSSSGATLWTTLGNVFYELGEMDEAEECYLSALELNNTEKGNNKSTVNMRIYNKLTHLYFEQNNGEECYKYLRKAIDINDPLNREYINTWINISRVYLLGSHPDKALEALEEAASMANRLSLTPDLTIINSYKKEIDRRKE